MGPYFPLVFCAAPVFVLVGVVSLALLVSGLLIRSRLFKWIGGLGLCGSACGVGACLVGCLLIGLCDYINIVTGPNTRTKPEPKDIAGVYCPTKRSVRFIKRAKYSSIPEISITLHEKGSFEMKNIPDMWLNEFGRAKGNFDSATGTWELDCVEYGRIKHWGIGLDFTDVTGITSRTSDRGFYYSMISLKNQKPPYIIHITIGDPDSMEALEFERVTIESKAR